MSRWSRVRTAISVTPPFAQLASTFDTGAHPGPAASSPVGSRTS